MNATIGLDKVTTSYSNFVTLANKMFRIDPYEVTYCGDLTYEFIREELDSSIDDSFLYFDEANEEFTLAPHTVHTPGLYDGDFLLFYFKDNPDLQMKVKLIIEIYKCEFNTVKFKENRMFRTYILNEDDFSYSVPNIVTEPDCSRQPLIESLEFVIVQVPEGVDAVELVEYDDKLNRVKWHKTVNL